MYNYKIIENRPELNAAQVLAGMNFALVKTKAASISTGFGESGFSNGIITKGLIAITVAGLTAVVYKSYTSDNSFEPQPESNLLFKSNRLTQRPNSEDYHMAVNDSNIVLSTKEGSVRSPIAPIVPQFACSPVPPPNVPLVIHAVDTLQAVKTETVKPNPTVNNAKLYYSPETFNASPNAKCILWQPASFGSPVTSAATEIRMDCNGCDFYYSSAAKLDNKNLKGLWLQVKVKKRTKFQLETAFKNIILMQTTDNKCTSLHPVAIGIGGPTWNGQEWIYMNDKFKTGGCTIFFSGKIDVYLIFEDAKPEDKLIWEDFVFANVVE